MDDPVRVTNGGAEWLIDPDAQITASQMQRVLSDARPKDGYEIDLDYVMQQCFEMFGKHVQIWRVTWYEDGLQRCERCGEARP